MYNVNIFAWQPQQIDPQQELLVQNTFAQINSIPANQTGTIVPHTSANIASLSITSNGITDGNFAIFPVHYVNEIVNFIVQIEDGNGFNIRDFPLIPLSALSLSLLNSTNVSFSSNFGSLSSLQQGGFFKGTFQCTLPILSTQIVAVYNKLSGYSSTFSVYPSGGEYSIRKINEDFDATAAFNTLATQPVMYDKNSFMNLFLGQIVGNANSDPNTLGIKIFEKISNFCANIADVEYCNVESLKSIFDMINVNYQNFNYLYPASMQRLIDILSIKHSNLFGRQNQWQGNFGTKGYTNSQIYGLNTGALLSIPTTILSAGSAATFIITYETFSNTYNLVHTNLISALNVPFYSDGIRFPLSGVNNSWGWNLVLPPGVSGTNVSNYYEFYNFIPGIEGSWGQEFIDFLNTNNTLLSSDNSYNSFVQNGGIIDNIVLFNLLTNLELLSA